MYLLFPVLKIVQRQSCENKCKFCAKKLSLKPCRFVEADCIKECQTLKTFDCMNYERVHYRFVLCSTKNKTGKDISLKVGNNQRKATNITGYQVAKVTRHETANITGYKANLTEHETANNTKTSKGAQKKMTHV